MEFFKLIKNENVDAKIRKTHSNSIKILFAQFEYQ